MYSQVFLCSIFFRGTTSYTTSLNMCLHCRKCTYILQRDKLGICRLDCFQVWFTWSVRKPVKSFPNNVNWSFKLVLSFHYSSEYLYFFKTIKSKTSAPKLFDCLAGLTYISLVKKMACKTPFSLSFWICFSVLWNPGSTGTAISVIRGGLLHCKQKANLSIM